MSAVGYHQPVLIMRNPVEKHVQVNGARLCVFDWPAQQHVPNSPALLFAHGASFHARCWDAVIEHLPNRCIALDFEGHGRSSRPHMPLRWRAFAGDVIAAAEHSSHEPVIGIGHSLGGHAIVQAAALQPRLFSQLVLIDPVIFLEAAYGSRSNEPNPALRRRSYFALVDEMKEKLGSRPPFSKWNERVFNDYCQYGLLPKPEGGFTLACVPAIEAAVYDAGVAPDADLTRVLRMIDVPALVIRSSQPQTHPRDFMASPTRPDLATLLPRGVDMIVEGSHFLPMESPEKIAGYIETAIRGY
jgi:pimeloyl-ACP methyl ester carboxylesterase